MDYRILAKSVVFAVEVVERELSRIVDCCFAEGCEHARSEVAVSAGHIDYL